MASLAAIPASGGTPGDPPRTAAARDALLRTLEDAERWPEAAASLLADLGFRLIPRDGEREAWHLLVALRETPDFGHFDPEMISYYAPSALGAAVATFDRSSALAGSNRRSERVALWGHIHVVDRIPVENRFLTFGGQLRIAAVESTATVVDLVSPAPIVRWGGHSQGTDELTEAIGAFFGRLMVPIDFVPGAAERIDAVSPGVLYRAFLADGLRRIAAAERHGVERSGLGSWIAAAWMRARRDAAACEAGQRLLRELDGRLAAN